MAVDSGVIKRTAVEKAADHHHLASLYPHSTPATSPTRGIVYGSFGGLANGRQSLIAVSGPTSGRAAQPMQSLPIFADIAAFSMVRDASEASQNATSGP